MFDLSNRNAIEYRNFPLAPIEFLSIVPNIQQSVIWLFVYYFLICNVVCCVVIWLIFTVCNNKQLTHSHAGSFVMFQCQATSAQNTSIETCQSLSIALSKLDYLFSTAITYLGSISPRLMQHKCDRPCVCRFYCILLSL